MLCCSPNRDQNGNLKLIHALLISRIPRDLLICKANFDFPEPTSSGHLLCAPHDHCRADLRLHKTSTGLALLRGLRTLQPVNPSLTTGSSRLKFDLCPRVRVPRFTQPKVSLLASPPTRVWPTPRHPIDTWQWSPQNSPKCRPSLALDHARGCLSQLRVG